MIAPTHAGGDPITSIDPHATHYQDPEARLKLRVYLASPQKFDEAIEFGFPSKDGVSNTADKENRSPQSMSKHGGLVRSHLTDSTKTFLHDDTVSLVSEDDMSMIEPDSPRTPGEPDGTFKAMQHSLRGSNSSDFAHLGIKKPVLNKQIESYTQSIAGSREMTLRMTLTRPDLRADEAMIYGWQNTRARSPLGEEPLVLESLSSEQIEMKGPLGGADGWGPSEKDNGVVRRLWNRVKISQRKSS